MFHSSSPKPLFSQSNRTNGRDGCHVRDKNRSVTDIETSFWFISEYKLIWYSVLTTYAVLCKELSHLSFLHVLPPRSQTLMSFFKEHQLFFSSSFWRYFRVFLWALVAFSLTCSLVPVTDHFQIVFFPFFINPQNCNINISCLVKETSPCWDGGYVV